MFSLQRKATETQCRFGYRAVDKLMFLIVVVVDDHTLSSPVEEALILRLGCSMYRRPFQILCIIFDNTDCRGLFALLC